MASLCGVGEVFIYPNGVIARIAKVTKDGRAKLRCINCCKGYMGILGRPYTYQRWSKIESLRKATRVGTEEILHAVLEYRNKSENEEGEEDSDESDFV